MTRVKLGKVIYTICGATIALVVVLSVAGAAVEATKGEPANTVEHRGIEPDAGGEPNTAMSNEEIADVFVENDARGVRMICLAKRDLGRVVAERRLVPLVSDSRLGDYIHEAGGDPNVVIGLLLDRC